VAKATYFGDHKNWRRGNQEPASDMVKAKSCIEGHSTTAGHVSNLPQPWVNETKETPQETGD